MNEIQAAKLQKITYSQISFWRHILRFRYFSGYIFFQFVFQGFVR